MVELDVVAESIDKKHILVGECKWTHDEDADRLMDVLEQKAKYLPFIERAGSSSCAILKGVSNSLC